MISGNVVKNLSQNRRCPSRSDSHNHCPSTLARWFAIENVIGIHSGTAIQLEIVYYPRSSNKDEVFVSPVGLGFHR